MRRGRQDNNNKDHQKHGPSKPANNRQPVVMNNKKQQQQGSKSNNSNTKSRTPPPPQHHAATSSKFKNNTTNNSQWSSNNNKPFSNFNQNQQQRQYSSATTNFNHPNQTTTNDGNNPDPNFVVLKQTVMLVRDAQNQTWGLQIFDLTNGHQNQIHARNQTWIKYKIEEVDGHSPASYAGLRKNDVVVGVLEPAGLHSVFIRDFNDFGKYLSENNSIRLRIERTVPKEEENSAEHRIRLPCPTNSNDVANNNGSQLQQQHYSNTSPRKSSVGGLYVPGFEQQNSNSSSSQNVYDEIFGVAGEIGSNNIINNNEQPQNNQTQQQPTSVSASTSNKLKVSTSSVKELGWFHKLLSHATAVPSKSFLMGSSSTAVSTVVSLPTRSSNDVESDRNFLEELMKEASV